MQPSNLANILGALASMLSDQVAGAIASPELPLAEATALALLSTYPGCSIEELRAPIGLSHSGCVRLIDRLVASDLVERRAATDGRAVALRLTRKGRAAAAAGSGRREELLLSAVRTLDPDEQHALAQIAAKLLVRGTPSPRAAGKVCRFCDHEACVECPFAAMASAAT